MTPRAPAEIRAEIARWRAFIADRRAARESVDAAAAAIVVAALTWALGEAATPTTRIRGY